MRANAGDRDADPASGVDPVHFGIIMLLNLGVGLCHPPAGAILFVGCAVGKVTFAQVMRKIWPFYAVMFRC
jgi:TRAP-type C4-dicarboxylate transport system permease large subunit